MREAALIYFHNVRSSSYCILAAVYTCKRLSQTDTPAYRKVCLLAVSRMRDEKHVITRAVHLSGCRQLMFLIVSPLSSSLARARQKMKAFKYIIVVILNQIKRIMRKVDLVCFSFRIYLCGSNAHFFLCVLLCV